MEQERAFRHDQSGQEQAFRRQLVDLLLEAAKQVGNVAAAAQRAGADPAQAPSARVIDVEAEPTTKRLTSED